jgi:5-formyltetrahydrofolate cyclo-ligase
MEKPPVKDAEIDFQKQQLRCLMKNKIKKIDWDGVSVKVLENLTSCLYSSFKGKRIAGYWPIENEVNIIPFLNEWCLNEGSICLPVIETENSLLTFHNWTPKTEMEQGPYKTKVPKRMSENLIPDVILVPLIAFDNLRNRLGKGKGYYDRTLEELRSSDKLVLAIGIAAQAQLLPLVPCSAHDQPLDMIVTEEKVYD